MLVTALRHWLPLRAKRNDNKFCNPALFLFYCLGSLAASVIVGARPVCISISQAGADLKQLQVRALLKGHRRFNEELNSTLPRRI